MSLIFLTNISKPINSITVILEIVLNSGLLTTIPDSLSMRKMKNMMISIGIKNWVNTLNQFP